jgi:hypothetical protein
MAAEEALLQIKRLTSKLKLKRDLIVKFLSYLNPRANDNNCIDWLACTSCITTVTVCQVAKTV